MKTKRTARKTPAPATVPPASNAVTWQSMIAEAAYYRAERRGFRGSADDRLADWLEAEAEIERTLGAQP